MNKDNFITALLGIPLFIGGSFAIVLFFQLLGSYLFWEWVVFKPNVYRFGSLVGFFIYIWFCIELFSGGLDE